MEEGIRPQERQDALHPGTDQYIPRAEAARITGLSEDYIRRNHRRLPFTVVLSTRRIRYSLNGIRQWMRSLPKGPRAFGGPSRAQGGSGRARTG